MIYYCCIFKCKRVINPPNTTNPNKCISWNHLLCTMISNCWTRNNAPISETTYQNTTPSTPGPSQDASGPADENSTGNVIFTAYPLRQANWRTRKRYRTGETSNPKETLQQWLQMPRRAPTGEHNWLPEVDARLPETYGINAAIAVLTQQNTGGQTGARSAVCCKI